MPLDRYFLNLAYHLALQNEGNTSPNPSVGAVVVQGDRIVSVACHEKAGGPHAEVIALERAGTRSKDSTLYCSLEPCAHHGKTPPCVDRIVDSGVRRVVFSVVDQNPLVSGKGQQVLRERGVQADHFPDRVAERFYEPFFQTFRNGRPYVYSKVAMTANGIISPADRNSRWITNETSLKWVHQLRACCDAVLVGADTVLLDRPHLTVRAPGIRRNAVRIVIDSRFKLHPDECSLMEDDAPVLICGSVHTPPGKEDVWKKYGVDTVRFNDPLSLLQELLARGIRKVVVEGGQKIFTLFHNEGLIDEYVLMMAPRLLTGKHSLNVLAGPEQSLSETVRLPLTAPIELDGDLVIRLRRNV